MVTQSMLSCIYNVTGELCMWYRFAVLGFILAILGIVSGFPGLSASGFTMLVLGLLLK